MYTWYTAKLLWLHSIKVKGVWTRVLVKSSQLVLYCIMYALKTMICLNLFFSFFLFVCSQFTHNFGDLSLGNIGVRLMWYIVGQILTFVLNNDLCMCMCICANRIHALQHTISTNFYQLFLFSTWYETGPNFQISVTVWQESRHDYTCECCYSVDLKWKVITFWILRNSYKN